MSSNDIRPWTSWGDFVTGSHRLAADVRGLLEQYGQGFGYLATVRRDGGPRVHPVCPVVDNGGLFCFVMASPKRRDLDRTGRYALHSGPAELSDDEAYLTGRARPVIDATVRSRVARVHRASSTVDWELYELEIELAVLTHRADALQRAEHRVWRAY